VGVKTKKTMVEVWVEDEGLGIPAAKLEKLLDIDSNYQRAGTNNENGTGLGLQLSNEFVKLNNGYFVIESEENKGSRFAFFLPLYESN
jgi:signal transduction histidine kinase